MVKSKNRAKAYGPRNDTSGSRYIDQWERNSDRRSDRPKDPIPKPPASAKPASEPVQSTEPAKLPNSSSFGDLKTDLRWSRDFHSAVLVAAQQFVECFATGHLKL